jgi:hypothetical protein
MGRIRKREKAGTHKQERKRQDASSGSPGLAAEEAGRPAGKQMVLASQTT